MSWIIVTLAVIIIFILFTYLTHKKWKKGLDSLSSSRLTLSKADYVDRLACRGYEREEISVVYDVIYYYIGKSGFSMYPDDDIYKTYKIDPDDYEDLIKEIFNRLHRPLPTKGQVDDLNKKYQKDMQIEYVLEMLKIDTGVSKI